MESRSQHVLQLCNDGLADIGFCFHADPLRAFESTTVFTGKVLVCVRKGHPILRMSARSRISRLNDFPALSPRRMSSQDQGNTCDITSNKGQKLGTTYYDSYETAKAMIVNTNAWGVLPDFIFHCYAKELANVAANPSLETHTVRALWKKNTKLPLPLIELLRVVSQGRR